jgi:D-apiose dehydrogenase
VGGSRRLVAVSGLGSIATQHIGALSTLGGLEIVAFDPSARLREQALASGRVRRAVTTFDELLDLDPDALIVASPDFAHLEQAQAAAERGIPSLVEKPLADRLPDARAAVPRIEATGTAAMVGYVLRHRLAVGTVRRLMAERAVGTATSFQVMLGAYGTITAAASRFATAEPNRLYRDYSHEWDYLRWIFGPIREVLAVARTTRDVPHIEHPNIVDGLIAMQADVVGSFHIDYADQRGNRSLHIIGTGGTLFADFGLGTITLRRAGTDREEVIRQVEPAAGPLTRQASHLLAVADGTEQPRVTLRDGLAALEATEALIQSAENRCWVDVPD